MSRGNSQLVLVLVIRKNNAGDHNVYIGYEAQKEQVQVHILQENIMYL